MARSFSYKGAGTVKTGTYGTPKNGGYIKVTGASFNESNGNITINYEYGIFSTSSGRCALIAAVCVAFGGRLQDSGKNSAGTSSAKYTDKYMCHGYGTVTSAQGSNYRYNVSYRANSLNKVSGGSHTISKRNSITYGVKAQMGQGWGWASRWNATSHPGYPNLTGGTLTFTFPQYDLSFNANGGSGAPGTQTKDWGTALTISSTKPTKSSTTSTGYTVTFNGNGGTPSKTSAVATNTTSYTFNRWNTASNGSGTNYQPGGSYTTEASDTLYAIYSSSLSRGAITTATASKPNGTSTRKVTFNATANGGSCSTASLNSTATITYSCKGWYTAASGGTKRASSGGSYTPSASETVYAQWNSSTGTYSAIILPAATKSNGTATRTVTFNGNGGSTPSAMTSTATITYKQTGWYTAASGGTSRGKAGATYTPSAAETVYAQFSSSTGSYSAITLPTPTRPDYIFKGWATSASATEGITGSYIPSGNVTLYAIWAEDQAKARIKKDGVWKQGKVFIKKNGTWIKAKKIYRKVNGSWQVGKNS